VIGIDTNVLIRYIAQDDPAQSRKATRLIEQECSPESPGFIGLVVLVEVVWVSESCYDATRKNVADLIRQLLGTKQLIVQSAELVWKALRLFEDSSADFADCLVERSADAMGCGFTATFDKRAAKIGSMKLL
jgi:predicted nucleic-acid-binding protein